MSSVIYKSLGDDFTRTDGLIEDSVRGDQSYIDPRRHYDLRAFDTRTLTVPRVMLDMKFWNVESFRGLQMRWLGQPRIVSNTAVRQHTIGDLSVATDGGGTDTSYLVMSDGDDDTMLQLEYAFSTQGIEQWPVGAPGITVGADPAYRYSNTIRVDLIDGVGTIVPSYCFDDILTDFPDDDYTIELVLRDFPAQGDPAHLDLDNSFIEFSSDSGYNASVTDRVAFSESLTDITAGGDVTFRIMRSRLVNADLSNLAGIRFILTPVGNFTFVAQTMRMLAAGYTFHEVDTNTRLQSYMRSVPQAGGTEPTTIFGTQLFDTTRPENVTIYAKFFTGHNPTGNDNALDVFARYQPGGDNINVRFVSRDTQSRLRLYQTYMGTTTELHSTPINTNILDNLAYYYLVLEVKYEKVRATIYKSDGVLLGDQVYTTGWRLTDVIERGKIGYSFEPYNYDFMLDFLRANKAEFAHYEEQPFSSITPVAGVHLKAYESDPLDLFTEGFRGVGDGTLEIGSISFGRKTTSDKITRSGELWYGGESHVSTVFIGDSKQLLITGDIFPVHQVRGVFRVALLDDNFSVGYIGHLTNVVPNQWNSFVLRLPDGIIPAKYHLMVHEIGFHSDQFFVDNLKMLHNTIGWEASADNGTHWQDFLNVTDDEWSYIHFGYKGNQLVVRATAHSDKGWIAAYKNKVAYTLPGHVNS